jgi:hypothetical protein
MGQTHHPHVLTASNRDISSEIAKLSSTRQWGSVPAICASKLDIQAGNVLEKMEIGYQKSFQIGSQSTQNRLTYRYTKGINKITSD